MNTQKIKRALVVSQFTLRRGYYWFQLPTLAIIGAGTITPYFPYLRFYQICLIAFTVFAFVGYLDKKYRFLHAEQSYMTRQNPVMMDGLFKGEGENTT